VGDHNASCTKFEGDHIYWSSLVHGSSNFITEGSQLVKHDLPFMNP